MANWDYGYVTHVNYPSEFHRETTPTWLAMAAVLTGHRPPDLTRPFRYADLGCGSGFTAVAVAAACSDAEVWGFDFNPAHVEMAQRLAARAGLGNATFVEASFADLARRPDGDLPEFDFIVSHGVLCWISPENRRHLIDVIGRRLRAGGLAYLGYNATTGWASMVPIRELMRMLAAGRPDLAMTDVLDILDRVKRAGARYFQLHPMLDPHLANLRERDPRDLAHEFLSEDWHPLMFADVADEMAEAKCTFVGSAELSDNMEALSLPPGLLPLLAEAQDVYLKETLRDLGRAQTFRRDIYRRGHAPPLPGEHRAAVEALSIVGLGVPIKDEITFTIPQGTATGRPEIYRPLLAMLDEGPVSVAEARKSPGLAGCSQADLVQAVALLVAGGYALPQLPHGASTAARQTARALNLAIAEDNANGAGLTGLAAPAVGAAISAGVAESFIVGAILDGRPPSVDKLTDHILAQMERGGRTSQRDGKPVTDPLEVRRLTEDLVRSTLDRRARAFRLLGILED